MFLRMKQDIFNVIGPCMYAYDISDMRRPRLSRVAKHLDIQQLGTISSEKAKFSCQFFFLISKGTMLHFTVRMDLIDFFIFNIKANVCL